MVTLTTNAADFVETDLDELARTTAEAQRLLDERDMLVIRAFAKGASLRRIAEATGMSHVGVKKLVDRRAPDFEVVGPDGERLAIGEAKVIATSTTPAESAELFERLRVVYTVRFDPVIEEAVSEPE